MNDIPTALEETRKIIQSSLDFLLMLKAYQQEGLIDLKMLEPDVESEIRRINHYRLHGVCLEISRT